MTNKIISQVYKEVYLQSTGMENPKATIVFEEDGRKVSTNLNDFIELVIDYIEIIKAREIVSNKAKSVSIVNEGTIIEGTATDDEKLDKYPD